MNVLLLGLITFRALAETVFRDIWSDQVDIEI